MPRGGKVKRYSQDFRQSAISFCFHPFFNKVEIWYRSFRVNCLYFIGYSWICGKKKDNLSSINPLFHIISQKLHLLFELAAHASQYTCKRICTISVKQQKSVYFSLYVFLSDFKKKWRSGRGSNPRPPA